jgi:hypothetical protein
MISCQVCWQTTEMAPRSNRRFPNLISVAAHRSQKANKEESGRNPLWPGVEDSTNGRIHWRGPNCHCQISLANKRQTIHPHKRPWVWGSAFFGRPDAEPIHLPPIKKAQSHKHLIFLSPHPSSTSSQIATAPTPFPQPSPCIMKSG